MLACLQMRKHGAEVVRRGTLKNFKRVSIMGTKGYMAPEMAKLLNQVSAAVQRSLGAVGYGCIVESATELLLANYGATSCLKETVVVATTNYIPWAKGRGFLFMIRTCRRV